MSKLTTNNIDVSEEIRYCNNCSNLGLDFKTGKFYCGLSNRKDELPEILSCENFSSNCYIKCLQKENELLNNMVKVNDSTKYDYSKLIEENKRLQQENEKLKEKVNSYICNANCYKYKEADKYRQALEEIRKKITPVCADCNNIDGFTTWDDCENVCEKGVIKYLKIIDEALNDRN